MSKHDPRCAGHAPGDPSTPWCDCDTLRLLDALDNSIYPVGLLSDWKRGRVRKGIRNYLWGRIKARNWRAVKNYFNGYLYEPDPWPEHAQRCGSGWTRSRAVASFSRRNPGPSTEGTSTDE